MSILQVRFITRERAIDLLRTWWICYQCGAFCQPYRIKQTEERVTFTMGCGCETHNLELNRRIIRAIHGGHSCDVFITFETVEKDGRQSEHMSQWGRSFLTQYYQMQYAMNSCAYLGVGTSINVNDTGGVARAILSTNVGNPDSFLTTQDASADNTYGMQVGTGTTANSSSTSGLATLIANGSAATQINYGSMGITSPSGSAPESYTFTRTFTNNSGSTITIQEAGMVYSNRDSAGTQRFIMFIRDVTGAIAVNNGANTTGTYTLSYTIA